MIDRTVPLIIITVLVVGVAAVLLFSQIQTSQYLSSEEQKTWEQNVSKTTPTRKNHQITRELVLYSEKNGEELNIQFPAAVATLGNSIAVAWMTKDPDRIYTRVVGEKENPVLIDSDMNIEDLAMGVVNDQILVVWARQNLIDMGGWHLDAKRLVAQIFDKDGNALTDMIAVDERQDVIDMVEKARLTEQRKRLAEEGVSGQGSREPSIGVFGDIATLIWQDDRGQIFLRNFKSGMFIDEPKPIGEKYPKDKELDFVQFNPSIGIDNYGRKLIVWQERPHWRGGPQNAPNGFPNYGVRINENNIIDAKDIRIDRAELPRIPDFPGVLGLSEGWLVSWKESTGIFGPPIGVEGEEAERYKRPEDVKELTKQIDSRLYAGFLDKNGNIKGDKIRIDTSGKVFEAAGQTKVGNFGRRAWYAAVPGMDKDQDGNVFIVWTDYRNKKAQIYGRYVGKNRYYLTDEILIGDGFGGRTVFDDEQFHVVWQTIRENDKPATVMIKSLVFVNGQK